MKIITGRVKTISLMIAVATGPFVMVLTFLGRFNLLFGVLLGLQGLSFIVYFLTTQWEHTDRLAEIENNVTKAEQQSAAQPDKVKPAWDLARVNLELYFQRNLDQVKSVFRIAILVMTAGWLLVRCLKRVYG